jgi:hypothetical protein
LTDAESALFKILDDEEKLELLATEFVFGEIDLVVRSFVALSSFKLLKLVKRSRNEFDDEAKLGGEGKSALLCALLLLNASNES